VEIPHDLVTVKRESAARARQRRSLGAKCLWEGGCGRGTSSQETCPLLVREQKLQITRNWLYQKAREIYKGLFAMPSARQKGSFCFGQNFPVPFYQKTAIARRERNKQHA